MRIPTLVVLGAVLLSIFPEVLRHTVTPVQTFLFGHVIVDAEVLRHRREDQ